MSALVTVTVLAVAGGVISAPGGEVTDGMAMTVQLGMGTGGAVCVGLGGGMSVVVVVFGAHPAASVTRTMPSSVDRRLEANLFTISTLV